MLLVLVLLFLALLFFVPLKRQHEDKRQPWGSGIITAVKYVTYFVLFFSDICFLGGDLLLTSASWFLSQNLVYQI